jgi:hypothetical protein
MSRKQSFKGINGEYFLKVQVLKNIIFELVQKKEEERLTREERADLAWYLNELHELGGQHVIGS